MKKQKLCVTCGEPLVERLGTPKTHPGECRLKYYAKMGWNSYRGQKTPRIAINRLKDEPTKKEYQMMGIKPPVRCQVKCLGPMKPEHNFESEDKKRIRICPACRVFNQSRQDPVLMGAIKRKATA